MNAYCTYFDGGFLAQGLALWRSLQRHDPQAALWVLALDQTTAEVLAQLGDPALRVVPLAELEAADPELAAVKTGRSRVEYYFTLSPCWPRWLLQSRPEIGRLAYVDADMFFFGSPTAVFAPMEATNASVLMTAHRFPEWLRHYEKHGRFNVGVLVFRRDAIGRDCLEDWRARCLAWCHDRLEGGKYADQKYLEDWPTRWGAAVCVLDHPGVNLAPWNWAAHDCRVGQNGAVEVDGQPLVLFHFARFRALAGNWWWQSGQLDYGVMPWRLRQAIYGPYWRALQVAAAEIRRVAPAWAPPERPARFGRSFWRSLGPRLLFGSDWLRIGGTFVSGRPGLGRYSGRFLATLRTICLRR
jgi:hypothetical protein